MTGENQGAEHIRYPEVRTWEAWRQEEPSPLELGHESVHLTPHSPYDSVTPKRGLPQPRSNPERLPEARRLRNPKHPHKHTPATRIPHPDGVAGSGPTVHHPRTPRPFLESNSPEHLIAQGRPQSSGQHIRSVQTAIPEELTRTPPLPEARTSERSKPEETLPDRKKQIPDAEETASGTGTIRKLHRYDGKLGRKHTEKQIEEIVDWYLQTGGLPHYVSERQRYSYRHHRSLPERRRLLEQQGITPVIPETGAHEGHIILLCQGRCNREPIEK